MGHIVEETPGKETRLKSLIKYCLSNAGNTCRGSTVGKVVGGNVVRGYGCGGYGCEGVWLWRVML